MNLRKLETNITKKHKYWWILGYFLTPFIEPLWFSIIQEGRGLDNQQIELLNDISFVVTDHPSWTLLSRIHLQG